MSPADRESGMAADPAPTEENVDYIRGKREVRHALVISDPSPVDSVGAMWAGVSHAAIIGIFLLLFGAFLYFGKPLVLPVFAAAVVALTLAPGLKLAKQHGVPHWIATLFVLLFIIGAVGGIA